MCTLGISRQPRGAALVIVMLVMAVLLLAGTSFLTISSTETQIALNERASAQANLLAEAAIQKAIAQLNANSAFTGETNTPLGGGTFTITIKDAPAERQLCPGKTAKDLEATASVPVTGGTAKAEIRATVDQVSYPYRWAAFATIPNQIVNSLWDPLAGAWVNRSSREFWIADNGLVDSFDSGAEAYDPTDNRNRGLSGHFGANAGVSLEHSTVVMGNVQAGGDLHKALGVTVTGSETSGLSREATDPGVPFPDVTPTMSGSGALTVSGNKPVTLAANTYYYNYIKMEDNAKLTASGGTVTIYVTGPPISGTSKVVDLGSNVTLGSEPGAQLRLFTKSDPSPVRKSDGTETDHLRFVARDGFRFYGSLYGKHTDVFLGANSQIYGSIIGRTIHARSGSGIHYDQAISTQEVCHNDPKKFSTRRGTWREVIPN